MANLSLQQLINMAASGGGFPTQAVYKVGSDKRLYRVNTPEYESVKDRIGLGPTVSAAQIMGYIAMEESRGNPRARGPVGEYGLWQVYIGPGGNSFTELQRNVPGLTSKAKLLDPGINAKCALYIFNQSANGSGKEPFSGAWIYEGLDPWTTRAKALDKLYKAGANVPSNTHEGGLYPGQLQLEGAIGSAASGFANVGKFLGILMSGGFWRRIGVGALAVVIIAFAVVFYSENVNIEPPK